MLDITQPPGRPLSFFGPFFASICRQWHGAARYATIRVFREASWYPRFFVRIYTYFGATVCYMHSVAQWYRTEPKSPRRAAEILFAGDVTAGGTKTPQKWVDTALEA